IWEIDDTFNGLMALPNLICLIALSGLVARITKNYFDRRRGAARIPRALRILRNQRLC
ncbi:MAG: alanine:cation symporter family protein, partial [Prevotella sp.]|nr:alanine:cation symporter family protein [Prevotella sp.]